MLDMDGSNILNIYINHMDNNSSMIKITFFHQSDVKTIITITNVYTLILQSNQI